MTLSGHHRDDDGRFSDNSSSRSPGTIDDPVLSGICSGGRETGPLSGRGTLVPPARGEDSTHTGIRARDTGIKGGTRDQSEDARESKPGDTGIKIRPLRDARESKRSPAGRHARESKIEVPPLEVPGGRQKKVLSHVATRKKTPIFWRH